MADTVSNIMDSEKERWQTSLRGQLEFDAASFKERDKLQNLYYWKKSKWVGPGPEHYVVIIRMKGCAEA